jgi:hypothetical protein
MLLNLGLIWLVGCDVAVSHAPIIDRYKTAECVSPSEMPGLIRSREWNADFALLDGSHVAITGAQMPGGRISLRYVKNVKDIVAADAGDYVYPSDVRLNPHNDLLYVKAVGLAAGIWEETWLFEYDLRARKLLTRQKIKNNTLTDECSVQ